MKYKCPLCGCALSEGHYHRVVKVQEKKEKAQKGEVEKAMKATAAARAAAVAEKRKTKEAREKGKRDAEAARMETRLVERKKNEIRNKRMMARIKKLEEERKMMKKHTSPQEIGLADEVVLVKRLKKEFPEDEIVHTGKGGDVLHHVKFDGDDAGRIVYECKHTDGISGSHIEQTAQAKKDRDAHYGILVTLGTRKGFSGLDQESGIFIVAQAGVLTLARICRDSLATMAQEKLDAAAKAAAAKRLMDYVTSPACRTPMEEAIAHTERAHKNLVKEIKQHFDGWNERHELYESIHYDVSHVQNNIGRVLRGQEPLKLERPKFEPLALPLKKNGAV